MKKQRSMFQTKEQGKTSEKDFNCMQMSKLPDKEFKTMIIKLLTNSEEWMN